MSGLLSDSHRLVKIAGVAAALVIFVFYASAVGPKAYPSLDEARRDPAAFTGRMIRFGGDIVRADESDFSCRGWDGAVVTVRARIGAGQEGHWISGTALFRADGTLDALTYHVYRFRIIKNFLAVLPLLVVAWLFFRTYAFDVRTLRFRDRRGAGEDRA